MHRNATPASVFAFLAFFLVWPSADSLAQEPVAVGDEMQLNTYTTGNQARSDVVALPNGFVAVWEGRIDSGISTTGIAGRVLDGDGSALGTEFIVPSYTGYDLYGPSIASDSEGNFVVVWQSYGSIGNDSEGYSIHARRFASDGMAIGDAFQVNTYTTSYQLEPDVAVAPEGHFMIVWTSDGSDNGDTSGYSVQGRLYDSSGSPQGMDIQINTLTTGAQESPAIGAGPDGGFVVVWDSGVSAGTDSDSASIQFRRFASDGMAIGDELQVNTHTTTSQSDPDIGVDGSGDFVVVWSSSAFPTGASVDAVGQRFASDGTALGSEFLANSYITGAQRDLAIHVATAGDFVVSWRDYRDDNGDAGGASIQGQRFASDGSAAGNAFLVNTYTTGNQFRPSLTGDGSGDFLATWDGGSAGTDTGLAIKSQRFRATGDVAGRVWTDDDGDGVQDKGEPDVGGVTVELYDDVGGLVAATTTGMEGRYAFQVGPGDYRIQVVPPADFTFTAQDQGSDATDSDVDGLGISSLFAIVTAMASPDLDAGLEPAAIGNRVWLDADGDGLQGPDEQGVAGVGVRLLDVSDMEVASTVTDSDGIYGFFGVGSGEYRLDFELPVDGVFSSQDVGADDSIDSDVNPSTGLTALFTYTGGSAARSYDAGLQLVPLFADGFESGNVSAWSSSSP